MNSSSKSVEQPLANAAGIEARPIVSEDPYSALDDMMVVVEALCPEWPPRPLFTESGKMLL